MYTLLYLDSCKMIFVIILFHREQQLQHATLPSWSKLVESHEHLDHSDDSDLRSLSPKGLRILNMTTHYLSQSICKQKQIN